MSIDLKLPGLTNCVHKLNASSQQNTAFSNLSTEKTLLSFNTIKSLDNNIKSSQYQQKNSNFNHKMSNYVSNLNLTNIHIDKMYMEASLRITNNKNFATKYNNRNKNKNNEPVHQQVDNGKYIEPSLTKIDVYHIKLMKQIYTNIDRQKCNYSDYIIIILYALIRNTDLINKQLVTAIPVVRGIPERSITEITTISSTGELYKHNKIICLHKGKITYTNDWITIENVERINLDNTLFKFKVNYKNTILRGIAFNKQRDLLDNNLDLSNCTLYISEFSKVWT
ncbi:MAG: hypothetical protein K1566_02990 [Candidatus Thiodiazotropha sp. (ex. Lucinisca nassula)]|nr:hypothetical protein [Candidatus Thiodiazotropha sp. (ex. Lucinisca nassula)]